MKKGVFLYQALSPLRDEAPAASDADRFGRSTSTSMSKIRGKGDTYPEMSVNMSSMLIVNEFLRQFMSNQTFRPCCFLVSLVGFEAQVAGKQSFGARGESDQNLSGIRPGRV